MVAWTRLPRNARAWQSGIWPTARSCSACAITMALSCQHDGVPRAAPSVETASLMHTEAVAVHGGASVRACPSLVPSGSSATNMCVVPAAACCDERRPLSSTASNTTLCNNSQGARHQLHWWWHASRTWYNVPILAGTHGCWPRCPRMTPCPYETELPSPSQGRRRFCGIAILPASSRSRPRQTGRGSLAPKAAL